VPDRQFRQSNALEKEPMKTSRSKLTVASFFGAFLLFPLAAFADRPTISQQPTNQAVLVGSNTTFSVLATGSLPLFYQWRSTCDALPDATNNTLTLPAVTTNQSGCTYWVEVANADGAVTSSVARLSVLSPSAPDSFNPGPNDVVHCMAVQPDGKILVGGNFTNLSGQGRSCIARLNADGTLDTDFSAGANGDVYALAIQADGKILLGGFFTILCGQGRSYLGRLNPNGTLDADFNPGANRYVCSLALQPDGMILVAGNFSTLASQSCYFLGRLNADGTLDSTFNPRANSIVNSVAVQPDARILVGGGFALLGGQSRTRLGRLNANGSLDTTFNIGANSSVFSLAVQVDGKILVGGNFTTLGGQSQSYLGRLNSDGTLDAGFNPGANGSVSSIVGQTDGRILIGGNFTALGGQARAYLGRLNSDGTLDGNFNPGASSTVYSLAVQADGKILVGGSFATLGGQSRPYIGRLTPTEPATQNLTFDGSTANWQRGGSSPEVWRTAFEVTSNGMSWTALGSGVRIPGGWRLGGLACPATAIVRARGFVAGGIYNASGWFVETIAGPPAITIQPVNQTVPVGAAASFVIAAYSGSPASYSWLQNGFPVPGATNANYTTNDLQLSASGSEYSCVVSNAWGSTTSLMATLTVLPLPPTITQHPVNQRILAGSHAIFSVAATGSLPLFIQWLSSCDTPPDATNGTLTLPAVTTDQSGCAYWAVVTNAYGVSTSAVAMLTVVNPSTADTFNPVANDRVCATALQADGKILASGDFTTLAGQTRARLGRINADGTLDTSFNPAVDNYACSLVAQPDGKILLGGHFTTLGGQSRSRVGRINADGTLDASFNSGANGPVYSLFVQPDGKILVGGYFTILGGQSHYYLGRLNPDGSLDTSFEAGTSGTVDSLAVQADGKILLGGDFTILNGQSHSNVGRLNADGTLDTTFNAAANGTVFSLAVQPDGKILLGGVLH
jgi:uncharacterized delta-60 repeat protein